MIKINPEGVYVWPNNVLKTPSIGKFITQTFLTRDALMAIFFLVLTNTVAFTCIFSSIFIFKHNTVRLIQIE